MATATKQMNVTAGNSTATVQATVNDNMPGIACPDNAGYRYVGARYVPKFAEPIDWNNDTTYEPLTIVTYQGNSYTSRTFVPVGIDITNEDYWALTGNYNAQIDQYRQEVQNFDARITVVENRSTDNATSIDNIMSGRYRKLGWVGDSFSDPSVTVSDWVDKLASFLLINKNSSTFVNASKAGAGFIGTVSENFLTQLNTIYEQMPDAECIVLYGGNNDLYGNMTNGTVQTAVEAFFDRYASIYPSVPLHLFGYNAATANNENIAAYHKFIMDAANSSGVKMVFHNVTSVVEDHMAYQSYDNYHPNAAGCKLLLSAFKTLMMGGEYRYPNIFPVNSAPENVTIKPVNATATLSNGKLKIPPIVVTTNESFAGGSITLFTFGLNGFPVLPLSFEFYDKNGNGAMIATTNYVVYMAANKSFKIPPFEIDLYPVLS